MRVGDSSHIAKMTGTDNTIFFMTSLSLPIGRAEGDDLGCLPDFWLKVQVLSAFNKMPRTLSAVNDRVDRVFCLFYFVAPLDAAGSTAADLPDHCISCDGEAVVARAAAGKASAL